MLSRASRLVLRSMSTSPVYKKQKVEVALEKPVSTPASAATTTQNPDNKPRPQQPKKDKAVKQQEKYAKLQKKAKKQAVETGGPEENIFLDVKTMLGDSVVDSLINEDKCFDARFDFGTELELEITSMASSGDGLAVVPDKNWVVAVPFCLPGEKILARVYRNSFCHSYADLVNILDKRQSWRDDSNIGCKYFGSCSGCQYQVGLQCL